MCNFAGSDEGNSPTSGTVSIDEKSAALCLDLLLFIALRNRDRISDTWSYIEAHFQSIILADPEFISHNSSKLLETSVLHILRICQRLLPYKPEVSDLLLRSLELVLSVEPSRIKHMAQRVAMEILQLVKGAADFIHQVGDISFSIDAVPILDKMGGLLEIVCEVCTDGPTFRKLSRNCLCTLGNTKTRYLIFCSEISLAPIRVMLSVFPPLVSQVLHPIVRELCIHPDLWHRVWSLSLLASVRILNIFQFLCKAGKSCVMCFQVVVFPPHIVLIDLLHWQQKLSLPSKSRSRIESEAVCSMQKCLLVST